MGPRLVSRGNMHPLHILKSSLIASMGPRLVSRGNPCPGGGESRSVPASMGPRLVSRGNDRSGGRHHLGPGASMGPRLVSRGNPLGEGESMSFIMLQWGRGSSAAETRNPSRAKRVPVPASMGPRLVSRGNEPEVILQLPPAGLQWGRGSSAAETSSVVPRYWLMSSFNGAAARQPRKPLRSCRDTGSCPASMGPRLVSRGNTP